MSFLTEAFVHSEPKAWESTAYGTAVLEIAETETSRPSRRCAPQGDRPCHSEPKAWESTACGTAVVEIAENGYIETLASLRSSGQALLRSSGQALLRSSG